MKLANLNWSAVVLAAALMSSGGCKASARGQGAPPTPAMPAHWVVVSDIDHTRSDIDAVQANLGGSVAALRNTTYEVSSHRVKVNTIVAGSAADAQAIEAALRKLKPQQFWTRRDNIFYELVGNDAMLSEMQAAMAILKR